MENKEMFEEDMRNEERVSEPPVRAQAKPKAKCHREPILFNTLLIFGTFMGVLGIRILLDVVTANIPGLSAGDASLLNNGIFFAGMCVVADEIVHAVNSRKKVKSIG